MHTMERSEPSLVPEWLRSNGGGIGGGSSTHHFASSQADGPILSLPISRSSKNNNNSVSLQSPRRNGSSSPNSGRSSNGNGFSKHDNNNSYARSYSSFSRSNRDRDRERSTRSDSWDSEYSDPMRGMIRGRAEDPLRRSQSLVSKRHADVPQWKTPADTRNGIHKNHDNAAYSVGGNVTGIHKVSFERDFPVLGSEERPKTPDVIRVSSPGLSRGVHSLAIANPSSVGGEAWTSALAEVPTRPGSNSGIGSLLASTGSASTSSSTPVSASTVSGLNMAEALAQAPLQSHNAPQVSVQLQKDELALAQSKKLIPVTPLHKTTVISPSDKLKPRPTMRSNETTVAPKNGIHHLSHLQLGSQLVNGASVRGDDPKSPSSGKLLVLKPGRDNGVPLGLKDLQIPTSNSNVKVANGHSTGSPSASSGPSKSPHKPKILPGERNPSGYGLNPGNGIDKRTSRSNFFKLMREKSLNITSGPIGSEELDNEVKEIACTQVTPVETGSELKCNDETCTVADDLSPSVKIDDEEERAFLLSLGWEDNDGDGEEGLTKKEIEAFYNEVMKQGATSRLCRVLQAKLFSHVGCSSSNQPNTSVSQTEA